MLQNLSIGVDDWQRTEMIANYYPESLPAEWRADFYLNDFFSALIAQADWSSWNQAWLEELQASFRSDSALYLRIDQVDSVDLSHLTLVLAELNQQGNWVAGFVVFDPAFEQLEFAGLPVTLVRNAASENPAHNQAWCYQIEDLYLLGNPVGYLPQLPADKKQQRQILQDFVASLPAKNLALPFFVGGESIKMSALAELKTLAELLGY